MITSLESGRIPHMARKTEAAVRDAVKNQLLSDPSKLYDLDELARAGYSEWAAAEILQQIEKLAIAPLPERDTYDVGHTGDTTNDKGKGTEKVIAKKLYNEKLNSPDTIGRIFDYEVPLSPPKRAGLGEIDLVSVTDDCVYLLEFKAAGSEESLLRCVLQIYTYFKQLPANKFLESFIQSGKLEKKLPVKPAVLVYESSTAYRQYKDREKNPRALTLMEEFKVRLFVLNEAGDHYEVVKP